MRLKKIFKLLFLCLMIGFTACGDTPEEPTNDLPQKTGDNFIQEIILSDNALTAEIKLGTEFQTIIGFGASYSWYADRALLHPERKEEIADLLFKDAKMTILRFKNEYMYNDNRPVSEKIKEVQFYNMAKSRAAEYGEDITVMMSSWSPPAYLKSNDSINGGGTLKKNNDGEYVYDEFAQWWADAVEAYTNAGVNIDYISIQNESDFTVSYDGMELAKFENDYEAEYSKAFLATYSELRNRLGDNAPLMLGPETMSFKTVDLDMYTRNIRNIMPEAIAGIAFHLYLGGVSGEDAEPGRSTNEPDSFNRNFFDNYTEFGADYPLWQTEFFRGRPMQTAVLMNNALVNGNVSAYLHWAGVWERDASSHDIISANRRGQYFYGSSYYVMRHFSEFIRPGYIRVQVNYNQDIGMRMSAYKCPDREKLAVVLINPTDEDIEVVLPVEGYTIKKSVLYQTILEDSYEAEEYYVNIGSLSSLNSVRLPAMSITTADITGEQ